HEAYDQALARRRQGHLGPSPRRAAVGDGQRVQRGIAREEERAHPPLLPVRVEEGIESNPGELTMARALISSTFSTGMWLALSMVFVLFLPVSSRSGDDIPKKAAESGFSDPRNGDVPEGAAEMLTPQTDRAIHLGLAWLAKSQNADGSFGSGTYRGNIAVTSLAGLAFMSSGSSPGRGPYGANIDKALLYVMENTSAAGFV